MSLSPIGATVTGDAVVPISAETSLTIAPLHLRRVSQIGPPARHGVRVSATEAITTAINLAALAFLGAQIMLARKALTDAGEGQRQEWERQCRKSSIEACIATA